MWASYELWNSSPGKSPNLKLFIYLIKANMNFLHIRTRISTCTETDRQIKRGEWNRIEKQKRREKLVYSNLLFHRYVNRC